MHIFVTPRAQDKLPTLSVTLVDLERVVFQGMKRQVDPDGATETILRDLRVVYRQEGDDILVLDVEKRVAPGIRGTSAPF